MYGASDATKLTSVSLLQMTAARAPFTSTAASITASADSAVFGSGVAAPAEAAKMTDLQVELEKRGLSKDYDQLNMEQTMERIALEKRFAGQADVQAVDLAHPDTAREAKEPLGLLSRSASLASLGLSTSLRDELALDDALKCSGYALALSIATVLVYALVRFFKHGDGLMETICSCGRMQAAVWLGFVAMLILTSVAPLVVPWVCVFFATGAQLYYYETCIGPNKAVHTVLAASRSS
eukprot:TRINITY_DN24126_c0_g1_i2.p1 TRINITY_DN24126_c0_g1~~TRINITY_DN24126_c0_g1_i2.p1  ORF type:complete len:238 (-),score=50.85 TRINITY_DN24126_c0_g1_i2:111-824(-)